MDKKYLVLQSIYDCVKNEPSPPSFYLSLQEVIVRQNFPWDEVMQLLQELESEAFIVMRKFSTVLVSITDSGIGQVLSKHAA